jgi:SAM-dependent methyltransferase
MDEDAVLRAYETVAPVYNDLNYLNDYEMWLGRGLLPELERHGLRHGRVLDVGCGTGRAFEPLLRRGWQIQGCDLSPAMLEIAKAEASSRVDLAVADMRELPVFGEFELVMALNDPVNYLFSEEERERALAGMEANLAEDGLLVFDCNTASTFATLFSTTTEVEHNGRRWTMRGIGEVEAGRPVFETVIEGDGIEPISHRERFWSNAEILEAMGAAGLECLATLGMEEVDGEVVLSEPVDEDRHYKVVYIGQKRLNLAYP